MTGLFTESKHWMKSLRLSSSCSEQNIGQRVVSIWHDRWQYLSRHSSQHPVCPNLLSVCLAMSFLVFQPSSCHLLVSILRPDWLVWLLGVAECDQQIVFFCLLLCRVVPFVQIVPSLRHLWCGRAIRCPICSWGIYDEKHRSRCTESVYLNSVICFMEDLRRFVFDIGFCIMQARVKNIGNKYLQVGSLTNSYRRTVLIAACTSHYVINVEMA